MTLLYQSHPVAIGYSPTALPPACILQTWCSLLNLDPAALRTALADAKPGERVRIGGHEFIWMENER